MLLGSRQTNSCCVTPELLEGLEMLEMLEVHRHLSTAKIPVEAHGKAFCYLDCP